MREVFPSAEHRHCVRHIHGNMKGKWLGEAYKDHLWNIATTTTIPQFNFAMEKLKEFNADAHDWLSKIPASQWSRSHFSGITSYTITIPHFLLFRT